MKTFRDKDLRFFVGNILRIGVLISMVIVTAGLILYLFQHGDSVNDYRTFEMAHFHFADLLDNLLQGQSEAIIALGVICLILTPVMRVVFAIIGFWLERDTRYTLISIIILLIIVTSMFLGAVE